MPTLDAIERLPRLYVYYPPVNVVMAGIFDRILCLQKVQIKCLRSLQKEGEIWKENTTWRSIKNYESIKGKFTVCNG